MDLTPEISSFQGVMISANISHPFSSITCRGGYEELILDIVSRIFKFLQEKQYVTLNGVETRHYETVRKLCFYLVLNSDLPVIDELADLPDIGHLVKTAPSVTECLLCEIVWSANIEEFIAEIITFSNPKLGVQLLKAITTSLKYCNPKASPKRLSLLTKSSYKLLCRLQFFKLDNNILTDVLSALTESIPKLMNYYVEPPNKHKMASWSTDDHYKFLGESLNILMGTIYECLNLFSSDLILHEFDYQALYSATITQDILNNVTVVNPSSIQEGPTYEEIVKYNTLLLDKCQALIMNVSVDVFCAWSEFEKQEEKTMQKIVGEIAYRLHSKICTKENLKDHPIVSMLPAIACKPVDITDIISNANNATLIENANKNSEHKKLWLDAITKKEDLLSSEDILLCLINNVKFLEEEMCLKLFENIEMNLKQKKVMSPLVKDLAVKCYSRLDQNSKHQLALEVFSEKVFIDIFETNSFDMMVTEILNRIVRDTDIMSSEIFDVFIQNPFKVFSKMIAAGSDSEEQADIIAKLFTLLDPFKDHYYLNDTEPCLIKAIQSLDTETMKTQKQIQSFVNLLRAMKENGTISGNKLFMLIVMPSMHQALLACNIEMLHLYVNILKNSFKTEDFIPYRAPLLCMLAQVLEVVRWKIDTFCCSGPPCLEETIDLLNFILCTYTQNIPDKDTNWLKSKLKKLDPLNMYYFKAIWKPKGESYLQIISGQDEMKREALTILLAKILPSCTLKEWSISWECLKSYGDVMAMNLLHKALYVITVAEQEHRTPETELCLRYCYRNFTCIVKDCYLKEPIGQNYLKNVVDKVVSLTNITKTDDIQDIAQIFMPLLSLVAVKSKDIQSYLLNAEIKHEVFSKIVSDMISNGSEKNSIA